MSLNNKQLDASPVHSISIDIQPLDDSSEYSYRATIYVNGIKSGTIDTHNLIDMGLSIAERYGYNMTKLT